jgi:hypothetical protein
MKLILVYPNIDYWFVCQVNSPAGGEVTATRCGDNNREGPISQPGHFEGLIKDN